MATYSSILAWRIPMDRGAWRTWGCKELDMTEQLSIAQHAAEIIVVGVDNIIDNFLHSNIWNDSM